MGCEKYPRNIFHNSVKTESSARMVTSIQKTTLLFVFARIETILQKEAVESVVRSMLSNVITRITEQNVLVILNILQNTEKYPIVQRKRMLLDGDQYGLSRQEKVGLSCVLKFWLHTAENAHAVEKLNQYSLRSITLTMTEQPNEKHMVEVLWEHIKELKSSAFQRIAINYCVSTVIGPKRTAAVPINSNSLPNKNPAFVSLGELKDRVFLRGGVI
jgi:hypothetical protein